ncbi:MAG TPA: S1/P1 nuclease [Candidatus Angelobacter sp.]|nr:S1/P1 nuclease [Candidatus Angelobacter sp.]
MSRLRQFVAVTLCLLLLSSTSQAWFGFGHMAVAYVAYQKLTAEKKARVAVLLKKNPYYKTKWKTLIPVGTPADQQDLMVFMIAATWPDEIKSDSTYNLPDGPSGGNRPPAGSVASQNIGYSDHHRHKYWHFVDTPFTQDGTALPAIPVPNGETEINKLRKTLALTKSTKTDALKSYDLVWLMHLVGDVHQPLHSSTRVSAADLQGDSGGNNVKLDDPSKELHAFWDGLPGDSANPADVIPYASGLAPADPALAGIAIASTWTKESFDIAHDFVYSGPIGANDGPFTVTPEYKDKAQKIAAERVALAGERLANLINDELK